jgi:hypothetical protein
MNDRDKEPSSPGSQQDELIDLIGSLALNLHINHSEALSCELPTERCGQFQTCETADYLIDKNTIRFTSIEARNRLVAAYEFGKNQTVFIGEPQLWISAACNLWSREIGKSDSAAGRLLALVHETDDIFELAARTIENRSVEVFAALHTVEAALPFLSKIAAVGIVKLCMAQHERTKNDSFASNLFNQLQKYFICHPNVARSVHSLVRSGIDVATANLYPAAIIALGNSSPCDAVTLALEDAESPNVLLQSNAIWTLGRLLAGGLIPLDRAESVEVILLSSLSSTEDRVRQTAIRTSAMTLPVMDTFSEALTKLAEAGNQNALEAIADVLLSHMKEMHSQSKFIDWLRLLCKLSPRSSGGISSFDLILRQLIIVETRQQIAISCFTDWVIQHAKEAPRDESLGMMFHGTIGELVKHPYLLSQLITDWFLSDNTQLANAAAQLLAYLSIRELKNPEFSKSKLDTLGQNDLLFLARRMLGFILSENHLLSLTMSFLKTNAAPQRTFGIAYSLLVNELGQDYPTSIVDALESARSASTDSEWIAFYSRAIDAINGQLNALAALPRLLELTPIPNIQRQFAKAREKQMRDATEKANEGSIIRQLVTQIPIKAGVGFFTFRNGSYTDTCHMQSFSHSVALPRRDTLDTVGYEIHRLLLRNVNREGS